MGEYPYQEMKNREISSASLTYDRRPSSLPTRGGKRRKNQPSVIVRQAEALDENRIVHFKKGKQLGAGYYIVEISSNSTSLFIATYDVESSESFLITLPEKRANDLMKEFDNSYEVMADSLQVMNKRLYLLNPKYVA